jgi:hypothetical protein
VLNAKIGTQTGTSTLRPSQEILASCRGGSLQLGFVLFDAFFESSDILQKPVSAQAKEVITEIWILIENF